MIEKNDGSDDMDSKHLITFITVARLLHFGETARTLNYSQSTISEHIHSLESYLNVKLFERIGRKVFLTDRGKIFLPFAERMVREAEAARQAFREDVVFAGSIVVGAAETLCAFWLPPLLKRYRTLYPQVQVNLKVGNCIDFPQWLQQNSIDVAFGLQDEAGQPQLRQKSLFSGKTVLVAAPQHELATGKTRSVQQLNGQTFLLPEGYCGYPVDLKHLLEKERIEANTILEFGSLESIKQCVKYELGISLLPEIVVQEELQRGELAVLPVAGLDIPIQAQMLFHRDKWMSPPLLALENVILADEGRAAEVR